MNFFLKYKTGDVLLIFFLILIALFLIFKKDREKEKKFLKIYTPYEKLTLKLDVNKIVKIKGFKGYLILQIKNKKVRVLKSTCPNKICVKTGWVSKVGESIVCIPNKVIIKIVGVKINSKKTIDYITN